MVANPVVQRLKSDISAVESKISELSSRVGVNHPEYISLQQQLAGLRQRADGELKVISSSLSSASNASQQREASARNALDKQKNLVLAMKQQNNELALLAGDVESAKRAYDNAMLRVSQTRLEAEIDQTNINVLNPATVPIDPSRPQLALNMILALVLGLCIAPGFAVLREISDRRVRDADDVNELYGLPVIGELPAGRRLRFLDLRVKSAQVGYARPQLENARSPA